MLALGPGQLQTPREPIEKVIGDLDIAALLEPCVPGQPDARQSGDFLAAQPLGPPPPGGRKSEIGGRRALAAEPHELGQFASLRSALQAVGRHWTSPVPSL